MSTIRQLVKKNGKSNRIKLVKKNLSPAIQGCPHKRGVCLKVFHISPKKPNSAQRWVVKRKRSNGKYIIAGVPGEGGHTLHEHSTVLVRAVRVRDLPGVKYKVVRGVLDLVGVKQRITSRSKYGTKIS